MTRVTAQHARGRRHHATGTPGVLITPLNKLYWTVSCCIGRTGATGGVTAITVFYPLNIIVRPLRPVLVR